MLLLYSVPLMSSVMEAPQFTVKKKPSPAPSLPRRGTNAPSGNGLIGPWAAKHSMGAIYKALVVPQAD